MRKFSYLLILFLCISFISVKAQGTDYKDPKGFYFQPIYTVDVIASDFLNPQEDVYFFFLGLNMNGFHSFGTELGFYEGAKSYGLQLKYGHSLVGENLQQDGFINGEKYFNYFLNIGLLTNGRVIGTKTKSNFQLQLGYRGSLGYYYYSGEEYIKNDNYPDGKVKSSKNHAAGIEFGLNFKIGFRPSPQKAVLFILEPINLQINNVGVGAGASRIGISFQL